MTNYERIKAMSVEEMARAITDGISSDPCDYCPYDVTVCTGVQCNGNSDIVTVAKWLCSEVEE